MWVYVVEFLCIFINLLSAYVNLKTNHIALGIINLIIAFAISILTVIIATSDIKAYFHNREIRKKYDKLALEGKSK